MLSDSESEIEELNFYEKFILKNRRICNGCYAEIRSIINPPDEELLKYRFSGRTLLGITTETVTPAGEGNLEWIPPKKEDWKIASPPHPQIVCQNCGMIDSDSKESDPKKLSRLIQDGIRLCENIEKSKYEIDRNEFFENLKEAKRIQKYSGRDDLVVEIALRQSISEE